MKIDNFALTSHQSCPAKYDLQIRQGWQLRHKAGALTFGGAFHAGLAEWYRTGDITAAAKALLEAWEGDVRPDDYRTPQLALDVLRAYVKNYPRESFSFVGAPDNPLIEVAFTLPLVYPGSDEQLCTYDGEPIEYGGIFDGLIEFGPSVYVLEHKTTRQLGPYYMNQFKPNNQVTGYVWASSLLSGKRVGGAIVNAICVTKTGKVSFERQVTTRTEEEIQRWVTDVQATCNEIRRHEEAGHWPWRTPSCTQYGLCAYHGVHVIPEAEVQLKKLEQDYVRKPWDYEARDEPNGGSE